MEMKKKNDAQIRKNDNGHSNGTFEGTHHNEPQNGR